MTHLEYLSQKVAEIGCLHRRPVCVPSKIVVLTGYVSSTPNIARLNTPRAQTSPDYGLVPPKVIPTMPGSKPPQRSWLCVVRYGFRPRLISAQFQLALILHNHTRQSAARSFGVFVVRLGVVVLARTTLDWLADSSSAQLG